MKFGMAMDESIVMSGCVQKAPPLNKRGPKVWRRRFLVLSNDGRLAYYRNERSSKAIAVIDLAKCTRVDCGLEHKKHKHIFDVVLKSRTYFFSAKDAGEMGDWVNAICRLRSTSRSGEAFEPVRRPARYRSPHSNPSSPLAESEQQAAMESPPAADAPLPKTNLFLRLLRRNISFPPFSRRKSKSPKLEDEAGDGDGEGDGEDTLPPPPPEVDRASKPRPPTYRHLKPISAPAQKNAGESVFTFPSVVTPCSVSAPSASSDSAIDILAIHGGKSPGDLSPLTWSAMESPKRMMLAPSDATAKPEPSPTTSRSSRGGGPGSSSDSGAESELDLPFLTNSSQTYHYDVDRARNSDEDEDSSTEDLHTAYFASSSFAGIRPVPDAKAVETEV
eukprot:m.11991 g.11991  ORF g.11991 m.11991 type:complete len:389 (+) comp23737_c0_seq1:368-1534(+)